MNKATLVTNVSRAAAKRRFITVSHELWAEVKIHCLRRGVKLPDFVHEALTNQLKTAKTKAAA